MATARDAMRGVSLAPRPRCSNISAGMNAATNSNCPISMPRLKPTSLNRMRVEGAYRRMANAQRFPYLEHERGVPAAVLLAPRFAGRLRIDSRGNTVFPHFDTAGLCGYEIKNCGFTGFAAGGQKGL